MCLFEDDNTWFPSNIPLNRRHILDSIQVKTLGEYQHEKKQIQEEYYRAREAWPYLSEYQEEYVIPNVIEHLPRTS